MPSQQERPTSATCGRFWHRNVVALVADGPLEGTYRELSLGLRAWEEAEGDERNESRGARP